MSPRRVIAALGRTLITTGVLLLLFVAYQLWGTGIAHAQRQNKAEKAFEQELAALTSTVPATDVAPTTEAPTTVVQTVDPVVGADVTTTVPPTTTSTLPQVRAGRSKMARPAAGKVLGRIVIKKIRLNQFVVEGSDKESLKTGPGHYVKTPMPGQPGNAAIACHRTTYGAPCFNLDLLNSGDEILVQTLNGTFRYIVQKSWKVSPKDSTVLAETPDENVLTLTTCDPKYSAARRLIVRAKLDGPALPADLFEDLVAAPTTDAIAPETELGGESIAPSSSVPPGTDLAVTVEPTGADVVDVGRIGGADSATLQTVDPAGSGPLWSLFWFRGHRSTWLAMLGYASVCALIWIGAWRLARRRRWYAQAVVYAPIALLLFGPALFFCFENVARLLPDSV